MTEQSTGAAGWHADPWFAGQRRFHDGTRWTADVFADGSNGAAGIVPRGSYGPPPTVRATPPPPAPEWGSAAAPPPPPPTAWPASADAPGPQPGGRRIWLIAAAVAAVLVLMLAALALWPRSPSTTASSSAPSASASPAPSSSPSPSPTPSGSEQPGAPVQPGSLLGNLVVRQRDVPDTYTVAVIDGGTQVGEEVTLDLCDGEFASEALRVERLQVIALDRRDGSYELSTEAVRYGSEEDTAQAFDEVRAVAADCRARTRTDATTGASVITTVTGGADASWSRTDGVDRLAYTVTDKSDDGSVRSTVVVYLRRGPLLLGLYFPSPDGPQMAVEGKTTVPEIVTIFEKRLLNPPTDPVAPIDPLPTQGGSGGGGIPA